MFILNRLTIEQKVLLSGILGIFLLILVVGFSSFKSTEDNLIEENFQKLISLRTAKKQHVENYFSDTKSLLSSLANSNLVKQSLMEFEDGFYKLPPERVAEKALVSSKVDLLNSVGSWLVKG